MNNAGSVDGEFISDKANKIKSLCFAFERKRLIGEIEKKAERLKRKVNSIWIVDELLEDIRKILND